MLKQLKYAVRQGLGLRIFALLAVIALNVFFAVTGSADLFGEAGKIMGITLSSFALVGLFVVSVIVDSHSCRSIFSAPEGYVTLLAPVRGWKLLLSRIAPIVVLDLISLSIGIAGIVLQSYLYPENSSVWFTNTDVDLIFWFVLIIVFNYLLLITLIFFCYAVEKSLFYRFRVKKLLWIVTFAIAFYLLNLPDFILTAFLPVSQYGIIFSITIYPGFNAGMIGYLLICLIKSAVLLIVASYLVERKLNV